MDLAEMAIDLERFFKTDMLDIIGVEAVNHFEESFENEGFTDVALKKWEPRKATDRRGRDITRYRTARIGKPGQLNAYGRRIQGRAILTGHNSGGDKLRNSLRYTTGNSKVDIVTDKDYAKTHNEGEGNMPKRQFMGHSAQLDRKILKKIDKQLKKILKQ